MGNETIQDTSFFNDKREKEGKNWKNRGKITKKQEKTGKNRKLQEIQKHHLDEVPENGNEFSARFREMLKTETETMSSRMSRNDDSRAKTMYRPNPSSGYPDGEAAALHYLPFMLSVPPGTSSQLSSG